MDGQPFDRGCFLVPFSLYTVASEVSPTREQRECSRAVSAYMISYIQFHHINEEAEVPKVRRLMPGQPGEMSLIANHVTANVVN